jgi:hypothetical protein
MKIAVIATVLSVSAAAVPSERRPGYKSDALLVTGMQNLREYYSKNPYPTTTCTLKNAAVRKEWCAPIFLYHTYHFYANVRLGVLYPRKKRKTTSTPSNVLPKSQPELQAVSPLALRTDMMISSRPISIPRSSSTEPATF